MPSSSTRKNQDTTVDTAIIIINVRTLPSIIIPPFYNRSYPDKTVRISSIYLSPYIFRVTFIEYQDILMCLAHFPSRFKLLSYPDRQSAY